MAKALIISGADFSTNKVTTISFGEDIPCTGITLDSSSLSVLYGNTGNLIATPSPANTTDAVLWSTSDADVATVTNGIVSGVGLGTATITATCGNYSATCAVVVTANALTGTEVVGARVNGSGAADSGNGLAYIGTASKWGTLVQDTGVLPLYVTQTSVQETYYPNDIPKGTAKIRLTQTGSTFTGVRFAFFNKNTNNGSYFPDVVKNLKYYEAAWSGTVYEATVENYNGFPDTDSFALAVGKGSTWASGDFDDLTIEFIPASD